MKEAIAAYGQKTRIWARSSFLLLYICCLCPAGLYAFRRPAYNWDMLAYMALVVKMSYHDIHQIHEITYKTAQEHIPPREYGNLTKGAYREKMATNPVAFYAQLPFYAVKPLYITLIYLFYQLGFSLPQSTVLPSILCYLLTGLLLFYWLKKYFKPVYAFASGLLIVYSTYMINIARLSTPDSLSSFLLLSAFFFILERPSTMAMFIFLFLSMFARLDNTVTCFLILSFLYFGGQWQKRIPLWPCILMLLAWAAGYLVITAVTIVPFGWHILYYPDLFHYLNLSYTFHDVFSFKTYMVLLYSHAITAIVFTAITLFMFLALLVASPFSTGYNRSTFDQQFSLLLVFIICFRFLLYPNLTDRFYISFYLCILVLLVRKYATAYFLPRATDSFLSGNRPE